MDMIKHLRLLGVERSPSWLLKGIMGTAGVPILEALIQERL